MKKLSEYDQAAVKLANTAFNKILQLHLHRSNAALMQRPPRGRLYHYTTAAGLKGIIENNELWATSAYFLNDPAEITYGYDRLKCVLDHWLDAQATSQKNSLRVGFVRGLRKAFGEDLVTPTIIKPIYLACFCEDDNLLSQWRFYGQSGGYSIGFRVPTRDTVSLGEGFRPEPNTYTAKWAKVEYDRNEQMKQCAAILDLILRPIDVETGDAIRMLADHPHLSYPRFFEVILDILLEETVRFKSEAFHVEKEWRVVVRRRELTKQATDDSQSPVAVHFWAGKGMLIPYVKLIPANPPHKTLPKTLPIESIRTGPTLDKTTAAMAVSMMLEQNGYPAVRVHGSDIVVRL